MSDIQITINSAQVEALLPCLQGNPIIFDFIGFNRLAFLNVITSLMNNFGRIPANKVKAIAGKT